MNLPSLDKFGPAVVPNGLIFLNSSMVSEGPARDDVEVIMVPTLELAKEVGSERAANMVMIGAVCAKTGLLTEDETVAGMKAALKGKEKFFDLNEKGIRRGFSFIKKGS